MHVTDDQMTSYRTRSINTEKKLNGRITAMFHNLRQQFELVGAITSNVFHVGPILLKFVMHVTNDQFSDKFNNS